MLLKDNVVIPHFKYGWIRTTDKAIDTLLAHALTSDYSQSNLYRKNITSIAYIIAKYKKDPKTLATHLARDLNKYFSRHMYNITLDVTYDINPQVDTEYDIIIDIKVNDDEEFLNVVRGLRIRDGNIERVLKMN